MPKKSAIEMEKFKISKVTRTLVRLKHSLAADVELNDILPETLSEFDTALQAGELKALQVELNQILGSNLVSNQKAT